MALRPTRPMTHLLVDAQQALSLNQRELGEALGGSLRTSQRWAVGESIPGEHHLQTLARLLYPVDRALAAEAASWVHDTLEGLGIEVPPPAPPAAPARAPVELVVESVVCAVAEVLETTPARARDALRAGFARARGLGLSVADVDGVLSPVKPTASQVEQPRVGGSRRAAK